MASTSISIQVTPELHSRVVQLVKASGKTQEEIVREALEAYCVEPIKPRTAYEVAKQAGWFDTETNGPVMPTDLSTNPVHMEGFGR